MLTSFCRPSSAMTPSTSCWDRVRDCCLRPLGRAPICELGAVLNESAPDALVPAGQLSTPQISMPGEDRARHPGRIQRLKHCCKGSGR